MPVTLGCFLIPEAHRNASDEILLFLLILQKLRYGYLHVFCCTCPGTAVDVALHSVAAFHHFLQSYFPSHFFGVAVFPRVDSLNLFHSQRRSGHQR